MAREELTGSRIRERRTMAGKKQADLARQIGISASYLNLIEHNRRRIGGKLLLNIAVALGVEPQALTEGAEANLIAALREAAEDTGLSGAEAGQADEFAGRFPGWAEVLSSTRRRVAALEQTVEALTDRMAHDPHLAASMHELLTNAAAVRSTASILAENQALEPEWRNRFHANINEDSRRLSDSAQALVSYLDGDDAAPEAAGSPQEEVEAFLSVHAFHFPKLERGENVVEKLVNSAKELQTDASRHIARGVLRQVSRDATSFSLSKLRAGVEAHGPDPVVLARRLGKSPALVLRRMAALEELGAGLVICDRSGTVIFRKSVEGFTVPRHAAGCPLWPLFAALGQPGLVVREQVTQLGRAQAQFVSYATTESLPAQSYNSAPLVQATMLLVPVSTGGGEAREVGSTCRVCPSTHCNARREPSILTASR